MAQPTVESFQPASYGELIHSNTNFRLIWFGQIVSLLGDWFDLIASASLVALLTKSGEAVGGLFALRMLAPFLVSPLAGVFSDRYNRKRLLIGADLARGVIVLGFLLVRSTEQVWLLYVLTAIQLAFSGFFFPARNAILPDVVNRRELGAANAITSITWSVMLAIGAALGGLVSGQWGIYPAFVVDSLSFFLSAMFISRVAYEHKPAIEETVHTIASTLRQYADGLRYLRNQIDIFVIALHKTAISLIVSGVFQVLQVAIAERVYRIGEGGGTSMGLIYAAAGIGTGIGPVLVRRFTGDREEPIRRALTLSYFIGALGLAVTAPLASFGLVLFGTFLRGFGGGINWMFSTQLLLENTQDRVRGRVFSTEFAMFTLASAISAWVGGWALDHSGLGISGLLWLIAILLIIPGILWMMWTFYGQKSTPVQEEA